MKNKFIIIDICYLIFILIFILSLNIITAQTIKNKENEATHINGMYHLDGNINGALLLPNKEIIAFGRYGMLLRSNDQGNSWQQKFIGTQRDIYDIKLKNNVLYAVGGNGLFMTSTDYGITWKFKDFNNDIMFLKLEFNNLNDNMLILNSNGAIYKSENFGNNWETIFYTIQDNHKFTGNVKYYNNTIYNFYDTGNIIYKHDITNQWDTLNIAKYDTINKFCFDCEIIQVEENNDKFYILTNSSLIVFNTLTNELKKINSPAGISYFTFIDENKIGCFVSEFKGKFFDYYVLDLIEDKFNFIGNEDKRYFVGNSKITKYLKIDKNLSFIFGYDKSIVKSTNNGIDWTLISNLKLYNRGSTFMKWVDSNTCYLSLSNYIYKSSDKGVTWLKNEIGEDFREKFGDNTIVYMDEKDEFICIVRPQLIPFETTGFKDIFFSFNGGKTFEFVDSIPGLPLQSICKKNDTIIISYTANSFAPIHKFTKFHFYNTNKKLLNSFFLPKTEIVSYDFMNDKLLLFGYKSEYTLNNQGIYNITKTTNQMNYNLKTDSIEYEIELKEDKYITELINHNNNKYLITADTAQKYDSVGNVYLSKFRKVYLIDDEQNLKYLYRDSNYIHFYFNDNLVYLRNSYYFATLSYNNLFDGINNYQSVDSVNFKQFSINGFYDSGDIKYFSGNSQFYFIHPMILFRSIEPDFVSSIEDTESKIEVIPTLDIENAYPNPTRDNINVSILFDQRYNMEDADISVLDYLGKPINVQFEINPKSNFQSEISINTQNLSTGMYLLNVKLGNTNKTINFGVVK